MIRHIIQLCAYVIFVLAANAQAAEIKVAVASNFASTLKEIAVEFQKDTGHQLAITPGATGKFYAQISNGAPFDVFLSADDETPRKLVQEGKAIAASQFTYAIGRLALWSPSPDLVDKNADILKTDKFKYIAIANTKVAPYGQAAVQTMQKLGVLSKIEPRVVQGESIAQTYQFVSTGNAQLGFVALSQILENGKIKTGSAWIVPEEMHEQLKQDAVVLKSCNQTSVCQALMDYLKSEKVKRMMASYGYK
jgi:molybdate transport system substrate-binding protein